MDPDGNKDTSEDLYEKRIELYIQDNVSPTPISPTDGSNGDTGKKTAEERAKADLNAFDVAFTESNEKLGKKEDEGIIFWIHISQLNTRTDLVRREKVKFVIYKPIPNQAYHVFPPISIRDGHPQPCHVYALAYIALLPTQPLSLTPP
jgi:hypothetical protein